MTRQLVFIHGRAQEKKDSIALKADWISAFKLGLEKNQLKLPIGEADIHFPYYGQTLYDLVEDKPVDEIAEVIVRGAGADKKRQAFFNEVFEEVRKMNKIRHEDIENVTGRDVVARGFLNWEWLHYILKAIDRSIPGASGASIALATNDVYEYLNNPGIRDDIEVGVRKAMKARTEMVVVSHSLGTVVAYNLLNREGSMQQWCVPLFVTLGSPLAVTAIKGALSPIRHPSCVIEWFNAMDERDVVALYPLDRNNFDVNPVIKNKIDIKNETPNRHGISGYLSDEDVAQRIYKALIS